MKIFNITFILLMFFNGGNGSNILFFSIFASKSHKYVFDTVTEELGKRGHNVVFFTPNKGTEPIANVTEVHVHGITNSLTNGEFVFDISRHISDVLLDITKNIINVTYTHPLIQDMIKNPRDVKTNAPKYDLFVIDAAMNDFALPLAYNMQVPVVYLAPSSLIISHAWDMNIPFPFSSVTNGLTNVPLRMTFLERVINSYQSLYICFTMWTFFTEIDSVIKDYIPNVPQINQLLHNVSFVIANDHPTLGRVAPTMPYYVQLGGLHCKPAKKLPRELENFMQSAREHGVIYFSFGSFMKSALMPSEMKQKLATAFAQLPQKILLKSETVIEGMPKNVKFIRWAPQQDILPHSSVKLFITHGGGLSIQEAVYHGCPILGIPLLADQYGNTASAVGLGYGEYINWRTFTAEELLHKIKLILEDPRYKMNAERVSKVFKDRPEHPAKTAAYWIEYVIRHNGAPHLKSGADQLNFFQYFLLDVIFVVIASIILTIVVLVLAIKSILHICTRMCSYRIHKYEYILTENNNKKKN